MKAMTAPNSKKLKTLVDRVSYLANRFTLQELYSPEFIALEDTPIEVSGDELIRLCQLAYQTRLLKLICLGKVPDFRIH